MNEFQQKIETLLFYQNQPVSYQWLARYVGVSVGTVRDEIAEMKKYYDGRGIALAITEEEVALVTSPDQNDVVEQLRDDESLKELSKQSFETLAIILYRGKGITKPEIDFIRGVNTTYTLRNLMIRGLVDKKTNPQDKRSPLYIPTLDLLSYLGVTQVEELSSFEVFSQKIQNLQTRFFDELQETLPSQE